MRPTTSLATFVAITLGVIVVPALSARAEEEKKAAAPAAAGQPADPQGAAATIVATGTATVVAVDPEARIVVLKTADGDMIPVKCGKDVVNFDQIKAGDEVKAMASERVAVSIGKDAPPEGERRVILRNAEGERPGFLIADTDQATVKIDAVDPAAKTVTILTGNNKPMTIGVGPEVDLSKVKKGDSVSIRTTTGLALSVERPEEPGAARPAAERIGAQTKTATVKAVDRENRTVTLETADGKERTIQVGKDAVNFDQVEVGDKVRTTLIESVAIAIHRAGAAPRPGEERDTGNVGLSAKGDKPGVLIATTKRLVGKIDSIDAEKRTVTITPADGGKPQKMKVSPRVELSGLKVGDEVAARVTDALAIAVEKPEKPQP